MDNEVNKNVTDDKIIRLVMRMNDWRRHCIHEIEGEFERILFNAVTTGKDPGNIKFSFKSEFGGGGTMTISLPSEEES